MAIIDCHVHLNTYGAIEPMDIPGKLARLRGQMDKWNLDHVVLLTSYLSNGDRPSAAQILEHLEGEQRIHVVEGIGVTRKEGVDWAGIEERLKTKKTKGLKIYPGYEPLYPTDPAFRPAIELSGRYKVPLMIHTGDTYAPRAKLKFAHPLIVDELCVDFPDVKFVICHCGNPWFRDTAEILYKNDNAYADISGLALEEFSVPLEAFMREELEHLLVFAGEPNRILYGTDWPLVKMGPYLRFVENINLTPEHRAMLLSENASRLFGIELPASARSIKPEI